MTDVCGAARRHADADGMSGWRIVVDRDLCQGHGVCESEAPDVFAVSKDGVLTVLDETPPRRASAARSRRP